MIIKSQKLRNSNTPKFSFDLDDNIERELKNTEKIKDYICNKLIKNFTEDSS